jgi:hypothetical protein
MIMKLMIFLKLMLFSLSTTAGYKEYIQTHLPLAVEIGKTYQIDPIWLLAHSGIETGWEIPKGYNYFGIKGEGFTSSAVEYFKAPRGTILGREGNLYRCKVEASWRLYGAPEESWRDYARLLRTKTKKKTRWGILEDFVRSNYATSPNYKKLLVKVLAMVQKEVSQYPAVLVYEDSKIRECPIIISHSSTDFWVASKYTEHYKILKTTHYRGITYLLLGDGNYSGIVEVSEHNIYMYIYVNHQRHEMRAIRNTKEWQRLKYHGICK